MPWQNSLEIPPTLGRDQLHDDDDDDTDDDDAAAAADDDEDDVAHLYSAVTPCNCSMLGALGRVVSFEACYQWALLH